MNAIIRLSLCAASLTVWVAQIAAAEPPPAATSGKVLLIDFNRIVEGDIARVGDRIRIRQGAGVVTIPATPTMLLLGSKNEAYQLLKSRAKADDPLDLVKLTRWCLANNMKPEAVENAEAALALQPMDRSLIRFRDSVKLQVTAAPPAPVAPAVSIPNPPLPEPVVADLVPESFPLFSTRVHPLLMNACANCHGANGGGKLHLTRPAAAFGDNRTMLKNLAAVSPYLDREQPSASPLLASATTAHGGGSLPPIRDRQTPAFKYLEEWVRQACGAATQQQPPAALPAEVVAEAETLPPVSPRRKKAQAKASPPAPPPIITANGLDEPDPVAPAKVSEPAPPKVKPPEPPMKTSPADPFDPDIFNQQNKPPMK